MVSDRSFALELQVNIFELDTTLQMWFFRTNQSGITAARSPQPQHNPETHRLELLRIFTVLHGGGQVSNEA